MDLKDSKVFALIKTNSKLDSNELRMTTVIFKVTTKRRVKECLRTDF